jgi:CheY-like chemotaxis protein/anti-anti-sigma regulatory factor
MAQENVIGKKALLVDDEPLARLVARKTLESAGCFVTEAESCVQAEEFWMTMPFDLVVLDHRLEDGLGMDLLRRMRAQGRCEQVIYLSAEAQEEMTAEKRAELQVAAVLSKPLNMDALQQAVRELPSVPITLAVKTEGQPQMRGRFLVMPLTGTITSATVTELKAHSEGHAWMALDAAQAEAIDADAFPVLVGWAEECRQRGGRFCLMNIPATILELLAKQNLDRQIDVLADGRALEALGRRLSSACERLALLDSIVRSGS